MMNDTKNPKEQIKGKTMYQLPCPFCNSLKLEEVHDDGRFWVRCKDCGATGPLNSKYDGEEDTPFIDWNSRYALQNQI